MGWFIVLDRFEAPADAVPLADFLAGKAFVVGLEGAATRRLSGSTRKNRRRRASWASYCDRSTWRWRS
jgi:hypothetical protein